MIRQGSLTLCVLAIGTLPASLASAQVTDQVTYYHTDAIGSVRMITDATGQVVTRYDYLPFGQDWPDPPAGQDPRRFGGKERDQETAFDYFGARHYMGRSGRFTAVDPEHVNGNIYDPQSWNGYSYAGNNPLRFTDPDGTTYEICADDAPQCQKVSDQKFANLQRNPGAGIRLSSGDILVGDRVVGYYSQISRDPTVASVFGNAGLMADAGVGGGARIMAENAVMAAGGTAIRAGLEASITYLQAAEIANADRLGTLAEHAGKRLWLRDINPGDVNEAIRSARALGQVTNQLGKYGTLQKVYKGANGVTAVVEFEGRSKCGENHHRLAMRG